MKKHKRCPNCKSRKWHEYRGKGSCERCGFKWLDPNYHKPVFPKGPRIGNDNSHFSTRNHEKNSKDILMVDMHDNVYKFKIIKDNPAISIGKPSKMMNWTMETLEEGEITFRRTTKSVLISIDRRYLEKIEDSKEFKEKDMKLADIFINQAKKFEQRFGITLAYNRPMPIMREVKSIDAFKSPVQFFGKKTKSVYPNGDLETFGKDASQSFANIMDNLAVQTKADDLMAKMDGGFNTLAYLLTQQNEILQRKSLIGRFIKWIKKGFQ